MSPPETAAEAHALLDSLGAAQGALDRIRAVDLAGLLGRVGTRFLDPRDPLRREAEARIPEEAGLSAPMARRVVEGMARDWTGDRLERLLYAEFSDPSVLDGFSLGPEGVRLRAIGGPLAFHLASGTVPGVGATSLLRSLLVKAPLLLKPGSGDRALPSLLARGIAEEDSEVGKAVAVQYWQGGNRSPLEEAALARAGRVVVYGGLETVAQVRSRIPSTTPLVAYHQRISFGAVARELLHSLEGARSVAREAALAVSLFDQRGCVSPHQLWVEEGGRVSPEAWAGLLAEELAAIGGTLPAGPLDPGTASALQQLRGTLELRQAAGGAERLWTGESWTVHFGPGSSLSEPCGGRMVQVSPIEGLEALPTLLRGYHPLLQTLAFAASRERQGALSEAIAQAGITRITSFGAQPWPPPWWLHDGGGPLRSLVRWVAWEPTDDHDIL